MLNWQNANLVLWRWGCGSLKCMGWIEERVKNIDGLNKSKLWLHEHLRSEFGSGLHVSFNFDFSFHESVDVTNLSLEQFDCIGIRNQEQAIRFQLSLPSVVDSSITIFQIDSPLLSFSSFLLEHFQNVDESNLTTNIFSSACQFRLHRLEDSFYLERHCL